MAKPIYYILNPEWVAGHCMSEDGYEATVQQSCCAPNEYLATHPEQLRNDLNECILPELFQDMPSVKAMKLVEQSVVADESFTTAFVRRSLTNADGSPGYIKSVNRVFGVDRPALTSVIVREIAKCGACIEHLNGLSLAFLGDWLEITPVSNETALILANALINTKPDTDIVTRISKCMLESRCTEARAEIEARFVVTIEEGKQFQPAVFQNFEMAIQNGRMNSNTVGFLGYALQYEMYEPQSSNAIEWFKMLLEDSKTQPQQNLMHPSISLQENAASKADQVKLEQNQREIQATLALNALSCLAMRRLESASHIVAYIAANEYRFVQSKYRMRTLLHKLIGAAEQGGELDILRPLMQQIAEHDENRLHHANERPKNIKTLLRELNELNKQNPTVGQEDLSNLIKYLEAKVDEVKKKTSEFGFDNCRRIVVNGYHKKPGEIKQNEIHLYRKGDAFFIRMFKNSTLVDERLTDLSAASQSYLKRVFKHPVASTKVAEIVCSIANCTPAWTSQQFQEWVADFKTGRKEVNDDTIAEVIAVLSFAYHLTAAKEKYFPRDQQVIAILLQFKEPSLILQMETGSGKTLVLAIGNAIEALQSLTGHTITANPTLAERDVKKQRSFFEMLGISVAHNIAAGRPKTCYNADRVYCDIRHLLGDNLRNLNEFVMEISDVDVVNLDEIDLLFLDLAIMRGTKIQLSGPIPGFEYLNLALQLVWAYQHNIRTFVVANGYQYLADKNIFCQENTTCVTPKQMQDVITNYIVSFVTKHLNSTSLPMPKHLDRFIGGHVKRWADSAFKAITLTKGHEYIIYEEIYHNKPRKIIAPVDTNTGTIQSSLILTDGLTQLLQIKEGLYQTAESLINVFTSFFGYFLRHKEKISGVTGTVGKEWHQKFLYDVYGVKTLVLPTFMESKMIYQPMVIESNHENWVNRIVLEIQSAKDHNRATLSIAVTINDVALITKRLALAGYKGNIYKYFDGKKQEDVVERVLQPGDAVIATNAAGRGTDLQISREVEHNGGLHVIETSFAPSWRTHMQAVGRGAGNGQPGTSIVIINAEMHPDLIAICDPLNLAECFERARDEDETSMLQHMQVCDLAGKKLEDWLFQEHVRHTRINVSPTGFEIVVINDIKAFEASNVQKENQLYLYLENIKKGFLWRNNDNEFGFKLYLRAPGKTPLDITNAVAQLNQKEFLHIRTVLSRPYMTLNSRSYELLHFIAAYNGITHRGDAISRVVVNYEKLWPTNVTDFNAPAIDALVEPQEHFFLEDLVNRTEEPGERFCKPKPGTRPNLCELEIAKLRELFRLWIEDRKLYHSEQFIKEANQLFGMHYKDHLNLMLAHPECNSSDVAFELTRDLARAAELRNASEIFFERLANGNLTNPAYMLHQAYAYEQLDAQQGGSSSGNITIRGKYAFSAKKEQSWISRKFKAAVSTATSFISWASGINALESLQQGFVESSQVFVQSALQLAFNLVKQASTTEKFYNWWSYNALAYFTLRLHVNSIKDADDAEEAVRIMKEFAENQATAARSLNRYIDLLEGYLSKLMIEGFIEAKSDFAIQKKTQIELFKGAVRVMVANVDKVREVFAKFKKRPSMIYISEILSGEQIIDMINVTAIEEFSTAFKPRLAADQDFTEADFDISDIAAFNATNSTLIRNASTPFVSMANLQKMPSLDITVPAQMALEEMQASGGLNLFRIESRKLKKDDDVFQYVAPIVLGAAQIVVAVQF